LTSRQEDDVVFYQTRSKAIAEIFHIRKDAVPALVLIKNLPDKIVHYGNSWYSFTRQRVNNHPDSDSE
jgi:hypothetical protein